MRRLLLPALCAALTTQAHALIDTNGNGLSDLWEKQFNGGVLFSASNPDHAPGADPDGDGWTNLQEATAGTNPFDANNAQGILAPAASHTPTIREPAPPGAHLGGGAPGDETTASYALEIRRPARFTLTWPTIAGKAYRVDHSADLTAWAPASGFFMGEGEPLTYTGDAIHTDNTEPDKLFYRVLIEDADSDGDGLSDWEEGILGTDPFSKDTDRDGIEDGVEIANGGDPLSNTLHLDPDGFHGLPASLNNGLLARWDLEAIHVAPSQGPYYTLARYADTAGASHIVPFHTEPKAAGMPSKGAGTTSAGVGFLCPPRTLLHNRTIYSVGMWANIEAASITASRPKAVLFSHHRQIKRPIPYHNLFKVDLNGMWVERLPDGTQILKAGTYRYRNHYENSNAGLPPGQIVEAFQGVATAPQPAGTFDDGKFHHYLLVRSSGIVTLYRDGVAIGTNNNVTLADINATNENDTGISLGRFYGSPAETGQQLTDFVATKATFDRVRVWNRSITAAEAESLSKQDIDNDGLWDITESRTRLWRDTNSDAIAQDSEHAFGSSPFLWQPSDTDTDGDGLTDFEEQNRGTDINRTDSDNDRLPDGWEEMHDLDPLDATGINGANGDPDGDGLTNILEYAFRTKPTQLPGDPPIPQPGSSHDSDGDGTGDLQEHTQGSHGGDPTDNGQPRTPAESVTVNLGIGDKSGSESENYSLIVGYIVPETGEEREFHTLDSGGFGAYNPGTVKLAKGRNHTFRIVWNGTNNSTLNDSTGVEGPDFDYTFEVEPQGEDTGFLIDGYDPRRGIADLTKPLLAADASNVAVTADEFREKFQNRRVVLMGVSTLSADRMFGASMQVLPGLEDIQLEITNSVTNEEFGTHSQLFVKAYDNYEAILGYGDNFGQDVADPRVWFIQTYIGPHRGIQAYLCGDPAQPHGTVRIKGALKGFNLGSVKHSLTPDADMAAFIGRVDGLAAGTGLGFPLEAGHGANAAAAPGQSHHWAGAFAAPVLMAGKVIEGQVVIFTGIFDGVVAGLTDDWRLIILIRNSLVTGGDWAATTADAYLTAWRADPAERLREIKDGLTRFMKNQVCGKLGSAAAELGTVQGFLDTVWGLTPPGMIAKAPERFEALVGQDPWELLSEAVGEWFDDFGTRMLAGAEQAAWVEEPFPDNALITGTLQWVREVRYTAGYTFGYLAEQATVGVIGGKAITLTASMTLKGAKLVDGAVINIAARTGAVIAAKGKILKETVAPVAMSVALRVSLEEGFVLAARTATPGVTGGKNILSVIEESYRALPGPAPAATVSKLVDDIVANPRLAALATQSGGALEILKATAKVNNRVSTTASHDGVINWPKLADRLIKENANGSLTTRFDDVLAIFKADTPEGAEALGKSLKEFIDGGGKFWIRNVDEMYDTAYKYSSFSPAGGWSSYSGVLPNPTWCSFRKIDTPELANDLLLLPGASTNPRYRVEFATAQIKDRTRLARGNGENPAEMIFEPYTKDVPIDFVNAGTGSLGNTDQIIVEGAVDVDRVIDMVTGLVVWTRN